MERGRRLSRSIADCEPGLWAVAGCLFEVRLPRTPGACHWRWRPTIPSAHRAGDAPVTLLAEHPDDEPDDACRLRFRAEGPGTVQLEFEAGPEDEPVSMTVAIAPEKLPGDRP